MMVGWILNLCVTGKASKHCVPISADLRQNAAHFWVIMCDGPFT